MHERASLQGSTQTVDGSSALSFGGRWDGCPSRSTQQGRAHSAFQKHCPDVSSYHIPQRQPISVSVDIYSDSPTSSQVEAFFGGYFLYPASFARFAAGETRKRSKIYSGGPPQTPRQGLRPFASPLHALHLSGKSISELRGDLRESRLLLILGRELDMPGLATDNRKNDHSQECP